MDSFATLEFAAPAFAGACASPSTAASALSQEETPGSGAGVPLDQETILPTPNRTRPAHRDRARDLLVAVFIRPSSSGAPPSYPTRFVLHAVMFHILVNKF
ncbi:hypothetical protein DFH06DRAFT_1301414 [Mycena polygramma]|nr:hypothetical protein DFH06DRAFT_1301414 [Mycena polygramma]